VTRFRYYVALEGPAIGAGGHRMGFAPPRVASPITPSMEEFISSTLNIGAKNLIDIEFFVKYQIKIK